MRAAPRAINERKYSLPDAAIGNAEAIGRPDVQDSLQYRAARDDEIRPAR